MTAPRDAASARPGASRRAWLAVALWTLLVWTLSSDPFSAQATSRVLEPIVRWLWPGVPAETLAWIHFALRKGAHLGEYAVLGALTLRALRIGSRRPALQSGLLALAFAGAVATADEARQSRSLQRTGSPADVALDAAGGALGIGVGLAARARSARVRSAAAIRRGDAVPSPPARG